MEVMKVRIIITSKYPILDLSYANLFKFKEQAGHHINPHIISTGGSAFILPVGIPASTQTHAPVTPVPITLPSRFTHQPATFPTIYPYQIPFHTLYPHQQITTYATLYPHQQITTYTTLYPHQKITTTKPTPTWWPFGHETFETTKEIVDK